MTNHSAALTEPIPFLDLSHVHEGVKDSILEDVAALIDTNRYINGPAVSEFEAAFATYCGTAHCAGVSSGLDALRLILIATAISPGDEVIVPANTFVATIEAVTQAGARPVLVDASEDDFNLDVAAVDAAVTNSTRFLLPVHLYGQMADMRALHEVAARHDVRIIEDACQAHGAERDGLRAGAAGSAAAFSFYPGKNLGAMGDAGAVVSDDDEVVSIVRALREHGQRAKYHHELEGYTARLDTIQAIVLLHKLPLLDACNDARRDVAAAYANALTGVGDLVLPQIAEGSSPVWHLYVVRTADPNALAAHLAERGVGAGRHYPQPVHMTEAYRSLGYHAGAFPVSERLAREVLSLPIFPGMTEAQVGWVADAVSDFFRRA